MRPPISVLPWIPSVATSLTLPSSALHFISKIYDGGGGVFILRVISRREHYPVHPRCRYSGSCSKVWILQGSMRRQWRQQEEERVWRKTMLFVNECFYLCCMFNLSTLRQTSIIVCVVFFHSFRHSQKWLARHPLSPRLIFHSIGVAWKSFLGVCGGGELGNTISRDEGERT